MVELLYTCSHLREGAQRAKLTGVYQAREPAAAGIVIVFERGTCFRLFSRDRCAEYAASQDLHLKKVLFMVERGYSFCKR
ncbi:hypothetical protein CBW46_019750 [Paenibacillus xerothermodurans]|uniref:Uncharacterized protein n=1 Tax=Paenibacillus xerothermodurans TaxID=1977292 RepID=A0A2W1NI27_PAEXE|nr:hypothetical protein CBW46_019750 [Paenibacillus xerothermodurans]